jgi:hypothetical protein
LEPVLGDSFSGQKTNSMFVGRCEKVISGYFCQGCLIRVLLIAVKILSVFVQVDFFMKQILAQLSTRIVFWSFVLVVDIVAA